MSDIKLNDLLASSEEEKRNRKQKNTMLAFLVCMVVFMTIALFLTSDTHDSGILLVGVLAVVILFLALSYSNKRSNAPVVNTEHSPEEIIKVKSKAAAVSLLGYTVLLLAVMMFLAAPTRDPNILLIGIIVTAAIFFSARYARSRRKEDI